MSWSTSPSTSAGGRSTTRPICWAASSGTGATRSSGRPPGPPPPSWTSCGAVSPQGPGRRGGAAGRRPAGRRRPGRWPARPRPGSARRCGTARRPGGQGTAPGHPARRRPPGTPGTATGPFYPSVVVAEPVDPVAAVLAELVRAGVAQGRVAGLARPGGQRRQVVGTRQGPRVAAETGRLGRGHGPGRGRVLERLELALDEPAEPGAVVALERPQGLDRALELLAAPGHLLGRLGDLHPGLLLGHAGAGLGRLDPLLVAGLQPLGELAGPGLGGLSDLAGPHLGGLSDLAGAHLGGLGDLAG